MLLDILAPEWQLHFYQCQNEFLRVSGVIKTMHSRENFYSGVQDLKMTFKEIPFSNLSAIEALFRACLTDPVPEPSMSVSFAVSSSSIRSSSQHCSPAA